MGCTAGDGAVGYYIITNWMDDFVSPESSGFKELEAFESKFPMILYE